MPNPFLAPDVLAQAGLDGDALRITNPLVADESVLRTSLRPGLLRADRVQRVAPPAAASRCSRSATSTRPARASCPTSTRRSASCSPARRRRPPSTCGGRSPPRSGVGARIDQGRVPPGLHADPVGDARRRARRDRRRRRGRPRRARGVRHRRAGRRARARPRHVLDRRAEAAAVEADEPSPVERPRPGVRAAPTTCRPRSSTRRSARAPARCSSTSPCSTCTAAPGVGDGRRSLAYRLRLQAPTATSPTPTSPTSAAKVTAATAKLGAELRG